MPRFSEDDVLDFMVTEALVERGEQDRKRAEEKSKQASFRKSHKGWDPLKANQRGAS
jgi:hypothetical protein